MEKINEMQQEYATKYARMVEIAKDASERNEAKNKDETKEWNSLEKETKEIKAKIENLKFLEEAGKASGETKKAASTPEVKSLGMQL
jgi:valyl-tRNA synthetase